MGSGSVFIGSGAKFHAKGTYWELQSSHERPAEDQECTSTGNFFFARRPSSSKKTFSFQKIFVFLWKKILSSQRRKIFFSQKIIWFLEKALVRRKIFSQKIIWGLIKV